METSGRLAGHAVRVLFDTGCRDVSFVSARVARMAGLTVAPGAIPLSGAFPGPETVSMGTVTGKLKLGSLHESVTLHVAELDPDLDVILGGDWLTAHRAVINYDHARVYARSGKAVFDIPANDWPDERPEAPVRSERPTARSFLSTAQVRRLVRRDARMFLVQIRTARELVPEEDPRGFPDDAYPPTVTGEGPVRPELIDEVLAEFEEIFGDVPPGLPPDRNTDLTVRLMDGGVPPRRRPFRLSPAEKAEVESQVKYLLSQGYIVP